MASLSELRERRRVKRERRKRLRARRTRLRNRLATTTSNIKKVGPAVTKLTRRIRHKIRMQSGPPGWGGCRYVTKEVIAIVGDRAPVTSRKRSETYGNPGSDHHVSQTKADAVDFGTANNYRLAQEIRRRLGASGEHADYAHFYISRHGRRYRCQLIAGTHGTGPHLHFGVRRA